VTISLDGFGFPHIALGVIAKHGLALPSAKPASIPTAPRAAAPPDFVSSVLKGIGAPVNTRTTQALRDWMAAEGGPSDNPLNTTLGQGGAQGSAIKGYGSTQAGINATLSTLKGGLYNSVIAAFRSSNPNQIRQAVINSPWSGSSHYAGTDYAKGLVNAPNPKVSGGGTPQLPTFTPPVSMPNVTWPGLLPTTIPGVNPNPNNLPTREQALTTAMLRDVTGKGLSVAQLSNILRLPTSYPSAASTSLGSIPGAPTVTPTQVNDGSKAMPNSAFAHMVSAMNGIAGHRYNYEWGGGHNAGFAPTSGTGHGSGAGVGYDCSGAISAILHAAGKLQAPLVASQFMSYGQAGPGGPNDLTIYASPTHVFAEVGGRFFGTSMSNPGGGAGWFQRAQTAGYTIRHVSLQGAPAVHMTQGGGLVPFRAAA